MALFERKGDTFQIHGTQVRYHKGGWQLSTNQGKTWQPIERGDVLKEVAQAFGGDGRKAPQGAVLTVGPRFFARLFHAAALSSSDLARYRESGGSAIFPRVNVVGVRGDFMLVVVARDVTPKVTTP